jgi:hypothetical protein
MKTKTIMLPVGFSVSKGIMFFTHENELLYNSYLELNSPHVSYIHFKDCEYQDLFVLSDEEIKEDDFGFDGKEIFRCHKWDKEHKIQDTNTILADFIPEILERDRRQCKKIIASTDKYLTPNNLITKETVLEFIDNYNKERKK